MTPEPDLPAAPGGRARLGERSVARIGFGAMQLERAPDGAAAERILELALAAGVDHLDTADFYGQVNRRIAAVCRGRSEAPLIATKIGAARAPDGTLVPAQRPEELRAQVEANLASLEVERLDLVYLRRLDAPPGLIAEGPQVVDLEAQLAELSELRDAGRIGAIGLSTVDESQLRAALPVGIAAVQNAYGVLDRIAQPVLELCRAEGIAWVPYFPLGSAFPGRPKANEDPTVRAVAEELGALPAQVALAWLLEENPLTLLIPGTRDPDHLRDNLAVGSLTLTADARRRLDALAPA